jgi:NhaA family Na+:H+ antiporter
LATADPVPYFLVGSVAWLAFLQSGVHATIAALLMAFTIPARTRIDGRAFVERLRALLGSLEKAGVPSDTRMNDAKQQRLIEMMNDTIDMASAPLQRIEHALLGPVTFFVLPLFALANAGVHVGGSFGEALAHPITIGIVLGLFVGKTIGVALASFLAVKLGLADLPANVGWAQLIGVGMLAGIGFTMALFVATLAFPDPAMVETAKVGILAASLISGVVGLIVVRFAPVAKPA